MPLPERGFVWVGLSSATLSLPVFWAPLGWDLLGLSMIRAPSRFFALTSLTLAFFAAYGAEVVLHRTRARRRLLAGALLSALLVAESAPVGLSFEPFPGPGEPPAVTRWIARQPEIQAYLELPLRASATEVLYLYRSVHHWKPLVNGFSGFFPAPYLRLREICCWPVPDDEALTYLRSLGVSHLVVHSRDLGKRWAREELARWEAQMEAGRIPGVEKIYEDEAGDLVFDLGPPA
jgi:hypothetical protein